MPMTQQDYDEQVATLGEAEITAAETSLFDPVPPELLADDAEEHEDA